MFSASGDSTIKAINLRLNSVEKTLREHNLEVYQILSCPEEKYLYSASRDKQIIVWDTSSYEVLHKFVGHNSSINYISLNASNTKLFSASDDHTIGVWDISYNDNVINYLNYIQKNINNKLAIKNFINFLKIQGFCNHNLFILFCYFDNEEILIDYLKVHGLKRNDSSIAELIQILNELDKKKDTK